MSNPLGKVLSDLVIFSLMLTLHKNTKLEGEACNKLSTVLTRSEGI